MDKKGVIFIIDDEKEKASALKGLLTGLGHDVLVVFDKKEAIQTVKAVSFDLVMLEADMLGGIEILTYIRKNRPKTKVFIYSRCDYKTKKEAEKIGIDEFLPKRVGMSLISDAIGSMLG